jgi:hypothetical protein
VATTPPKRVNAGEREVTTYTVLNADDTNVEREQLNRILKKLKSEVDAVNNGNGNGGGVTVHGQLSGLGADDHSQYLTRFRALILLSQILIDQSGVDWDVDTNAEEVNLFILTSVGTAEEALSAGDFVNLDLTTGAVQLADASVNDEMAHGFVLEDYADAATDVRVYYGAENNALSGLIPGRIYYLSDTVPGGVTNLPPGDASPIVVQQLGVAKSATSLLVNIQSPIERPMEN